MRIKLHKNGKKRDPAGDFWMMQVHFQHQMNNQSQFLSSFDYIYDVHLYSTTGQSLNLVLPLCGIQLLFCIGFILVLHLLCFGLVLLNIQPLPLAMVCTIVKKVETVSPKLQRPTIKEVILVDLPMQNGLKETKWH